MKARAEIHCVRARSILLRNVRVYEANLLSVSDFKVVSVVSVLAILPFSVTK